METASNAPFKSSAASPIKPRLIWGGSFHLQDGTALHGLAFISYDPPDFTSQQQISSSIPIAEASSSSSSSSLLKPPPLTLAKDQQDALSLSIQMLRHAPINVVEVIEKVDKDERGSLLKPRRIISTNPKENNENFKVSYEAAGGLRMFVDPSCSSTTAFFERVFCYDDDEDNREDNDYSKEEEKGRENNLDDTYLGANNVIVLSLDKLYRYSLDTASQDDEDDVFSEDTRSAWHNIKTNTNGAIEAVLIGVKNKSADGTMKLEMHVGQKVITKISSSSSRTTTTTTTSSARQSKIALMESPFGIRPDDPAPRGLSRVLSTRYRSSPQLVSQNRSSSFSSSSPTFVSPALPASRDSSSILKRPSLSNNGSENRVPCLSNIPQERTTSTGRLDKRARTASSSREGSEDHQQNGSTSDEKIEEKNRSLIKKLVHHQLLGKGLEKNDADYLACFNPTCNGTVLALRKQFKVESIDKGQAAVIVGKHLDMYL